MEETRLFTLFNEGVVNRNMYYRIWEKFKDGEFSKDDLKCINFNATEKEIQKEFCKLVYYGFANVVNNTEKKALYRLQTLKHGISTPHKPDIAKLEEFLNGAGVTLDEYKNTYESYDNLRRLLDVDVYETIKATSGLTDYDMYVVIER